MGAKLEDLEFKKRNFQPGPGNYNYKTLDSIPSMKFGSSQRVDLGGGKDSRYKPGPGAYTGSKESVQHAAPRYGFGSGTRTELNRLSVPGPGSYAPKTFLGTEAPAVSMGAQTTYEPHVKE